MDHLSHPVVSRLTLFTLSCCIRLWRDQSFLVYHHITYSCYFVVSYLILLLHSLSLWRCLELLLEEIQLLSQAFPFRSTSKFSRVRFRLVYYHYYYFYYYFIYLISLVGMALFWGAIRRDSVSFLKFSFLPLNFMFFFSYLLSLSLSLSHTHTHTLSLSLSHTRTLSLSLSHTHTWKTATRHCVPTAWKSVG